jgi:hypothetical protein
MQYQVRNNWLSKQDSNQSMHFICSLLADEKRERICVALEAVSLRPEIRCRGKVLYDDLSADLDQLPVIENSDPNFRNGSIPTSEAIAGSAESSSL